MTRTLHDRPRRGHLTRPPDRRTLRLRARTTRQSDRQTVVKERNSVACAIPKRATELSAPEGIRTPNLLIRRHRPILDGRGDLVGDVLSHEVAFWDMALA